jgi:excisionase family DNA binding protein
MTSPSEYLRAGEIARLTGTSLRTARRWIAIGVLPSVKLGGARHGPRGQLLLYIGARHTKTKKQDIITEVPDEVARRLRWYRRHVLRASAPT